MNYGLTAGYLLGEHYGIEFQWNKTQADTVAQPAGGGQDRKVFNLNQNQYMGNFLFHFAERESKLRPFAFFGMGASDLSPDRSGVNGVTRFAFSLGGGAKYNFSKHLGFRGQAKWSPHTSLPRMADIGATPSGGGAGSWVMTTISTSSMFLADHFAVLKGIQLRPSRSTRRRNKNQRLSVHGKKKQQKRSAALSSPRPFPLPVLRLVQASCWQAATSLPHASPTKSRNLQPSEALFSSPITEAERGASAASSTQAGHLPHHDDLFPWQHQLRLLRHWNGIWQRGPEATPQTDWRAVPRRFPLSLAMEALGRPSLPDRQFQHHPAVPERKRRRSTSGCRYPNQTHCRGIPRQP